MARTRTDLIRQALQELGLLASGQTPPPEDSEAVDEHVDGVLAMLSRRDIVTVDDVDDIPEEWFLPLATILGDASASSFGMAGLPASASNRDPVGDAERMLREIEYGRPTYEAARSEYF
jgi:hypothetical protein